VVPRPLLSLTDFPQRRKGRGRDWRPPRLVRLQCYLGRRTNLRDSRQENGSGSCLCNLIPSSTSIEDVEGFVELCLPTHSPARRMSSTGTTAGHVFVSPPSAVSPKHTLYAEILSVTSVMRKNSRWASPHYSLSARDSALASSLGLRRPSTLDPSTGQSGSSERDLMLNFQELKREINTVTGMWCYPSGSIPNGSLSSLRHPKHTFDFSPLSLFRDHSLAAIHRANHLRSIVLVTLHILVRLDYAGFPVGGKCPG